jgi:hypothetical protein
LVLPISEQLEARVFEIDAAVEAFRRAINDVKLALPTRNAVSPTILSLFELLREDRLVRISRLSPEENVQ